MKTKLEIEKTLERKDYCAISYSTTEGKKLNRKAEAARLFYNILTFMLNAKEITKTDETALVCVSNEGTILRLDYCGYPNIVLNEINNILTMKKMPETSGTGQYIKQIKL